MRSQSLADGAAGIALLQIERHHHGVGCVEDVHALISAAAHGPVVAADDAGLYYGLPALAFALHAAERAMPGLYSRPLAAVDAHVTRLAHRRVDLATRRIRRGDAPDLAEFDLIYGLTGIGAHLLRNRHGDDTLERILSYVVRLAEPLRIDGEDLPGWWTWHDPHFATSHEFAGGHGNLSIAHGVTGPLALLALAHRNGAVVDGHVDAIERICAWLDAWRQDDQQTPWWPQWVARVDRKDGRIHDYQAGRPSWCYGTPGIARAQQLAALATGDLARQQMAESALLGCITDRSTVDRLDNAGLCHGRAGLYQTLWRAAADATTPDLDARLADVATGLNDQLDPGFLLGQAGVDLVRHTIARKTPPVTGWDTCLLIA